MKVTMTESICPEGMEMLDGAEIFVAHDAHPHNYLDQLKDTDAFIVRVADKGAVDAQTMDEGGFRVIGRTGVGYRQCGYSCSYCQRYSCSNYTRS